MRSRNFGGKSDKEWAREVFRTIRKMCAKFRGIPMTKAQMDTVLFDIGMEASIGLSWLNRRKKGGAK